MSRRGEFVALECRLYVGCFSCERAYEFVQSDGRTRTGWDQTLRMWKRDGSKLGDDEPTGNDSIDGLLAVRIMDETPDGEFVVGFWSVQDWERATVDRWAVRERPEPADTRFKC
jgi:hypothetical protein